MQAAPTGLWQLDPLEDEKVAFGKVPRVAALDDHSRFRVRARFVHRKWETDILGALAGLLARWGLPNPLLTDWAVSFLGTQEVPSGATTYRLALAAQRSGTRHPGPAPPRQPVCGL